MRELARDPVRRFTVYEYHRMIEAGIFGDDERVELVDGEFVTLPPIARNHAFLVRTLAQAFVERFSKRAIVDVGQNVIVEERSAPLADILILDNKPDGYLDEIPHAQDVFFLVDISDATLRYDRRRTLPAYAAAGIREVWIVDMNEGCVERFSEPVDGKYAAFERIERAGWIAPLAFPEETIAVSDFLPYASRARNAQALNRL